MPTNQLPIVTSLELFDITALLGKTDCFGQGCIYIVNRRKPVLHDFPWSYWEKNWSYTWFCYLVFDFIHFVLFASKLKIFFSRPVNVIYVNVVQTTCMFMYKCSDWVVTPKNVDFCKLYMWSIWNSFVTNLGYQFKTLLWHIHATSLQLFCDLHVYRLQETWARSTSPLEGPCQWSGLGMYRGDWTTSPPGCRPTTNNPSSWWVLKGVERGK